MLNAAVDQQRVRPLVKTSVAVFEMGKPAPEHLLHGGVVVLIVQTFDFEAFVVLLARSSVDENDHRRDHIRTRDVRNIVGLQPVKRRIQPQHALQEAQRSGGALGLCGHALCFLSRVFLRKVDKAHIVAPLRRADVNLFLQVLIE